jgi:hypothetical protein
MRHDEKQKELDINFWITKMRLQHWGMITYVHAKRFINPGGPPVFKLLYIFFRGQPRLINNGGLINPDLTLYIYSLR